MLKKLFVFTLFFLASTIVFAANTKEEETTSPTPETTEITASESNKIMVNLSNDFFSYSSGDSDTRAFGLYPVSSDLSFGYKIIPDLWISGRFGFKSTNVDDGEKDKSLSDMLFAAGVDYDLMTTSEYRFYAGGKFIYIDSEYEFRWGDDTAIGLEGSIAAEYYLSSYFSAGGKAYLRFLSLDNADDSVTQFNLAFSGTIYF